MQSGFAGYRVKLDNNANTLIQNADRRNERVLVSGKSTEWDANAAGGRGAWVYHPEVYYNAKEGYLFTDASSRAAVSPTSA